MITKEEMYEFASNIAGITDADLAMYKCGGKTKKMQNGGKEVKNKQPQGQRRPRLYDSHDNDNSPTLKQPNGIEHREKEGEQATLPKQASKPQPLERYPISRQKPRRRF